MGTKNDQLRLPLHGYPKEKTPNSSITSYSNQKTESDNQT